MNTKCPTCNSGATQAVGMVVLSGTRSWAGNSVSTSFRGNPRAGANWGTSRSALVAALDPGPRPSYITLTAGVLLAFAFSTFVVVPELKGLSASVVALATLAFVPFAFWRRYAARRGWAARVLALAGAWVCRKCGSTWTPEA